MKIWWIMICLGLGTFLIRVSFIALFGKLEIPTLLQRALRFIPACVLFSLVIPQLITYDNDVDISLSNPRLIAGMLAGLISWRTKNVMLTILSGMLVLWLLQAFYTNP